MVVIQIKRNEVDTFLYETTCDTPNDDMIRNLVSNLFLFFLVVSWSKKNIFFIYKKVAVWNMRIRLQQLVGSIRELAKYGPMKPPDKAGLDEVWEFQFFFFLIFYF
jgi:hypothetical protein